MRQQTKPFTVEIKQSRKLKPTDRKTSIWGKLATATFVLTGVITLYYNYLEQRSTLVTVCIYASLVITVISAAHYLFRVVRLASASHTAPSKR